VTQTWSMARTDVRETRVAANSSGRTKAAESRALDVTDVTITLQHVPTGIEVSGSVPPGHYSRSVMKTRREELRKRLFAELEALVGKRLRIAGR
jgi:hypothetical protein